MVSLEDVVESLKSFLVERGFAQSPQNITGRVIRDSWLLPSKVVFTYPTNTGTSSLEARINKPWMHSGTWRATIPLDPESVTLDISKQKNALTYHETDSTLAFLGKGKRNLSVLYQQVPSAKSNLALYLLMGAELALIETGLAKSVFTNLDIHAQNENLIGVAVAITGTQFLIPGMFLGELIGMNYVNQKLAPHDPLTRITDLKEQKLNFTKTTPWKARLEFEEYLLAWYYHGDEDTDVFATYAKHSDAINRILAQRQEGQAARVLDILFKGGPPPRTGETGDTTLYTLAERLAPIDAEAAAREVREFLRILKSDHLVAKDETLDGLVTLTKHVIEKSKSTKHKTVFATFEQTFNDTLSRAARPMYAREIETITNASMRTIHRTRVADIASTAALACMYVFSQHYQGSAILWGALIGGKAVLDGMMSSIRNRITESYFLFVYRKLLERSNANPDATMSEYNSVGYRWYHLGHIIGATIGVPLMYLSTATNTAPTTIAQILGVTAVGVTYAMFRKVMKEALEQKFTHRV
ncbi:hypothetical protein HY490_00875 [Candidatus Woesearchaeota archaeon]|nr:hypothetical protein [Candidatus Woesearchaeota archaeon]